MSSDLRSPLDPKAAWPAQFTAEIAVIIPCHNEGATIAGVVAGFARALPGARIYVCDNNSSDDTAEQARKAGAVVTRESRKGKGNVVRRMFADVEADVYVMADGDLTYEAAAAPLLVRRLLEDNLDMVVGRRVHTRPGAYRRGHVLGNRLFTRTVELLFGRSFQDILSGYRVFSRRFVKSFPMLSEGFEVEAEMTIHALSLRMATAELPTLYAERPGGSESKLSTFKDGFKILRKIAVLLKNEKPLHLFSALGLGFAATSLLLGVPVVEAFLVTGLVERLPTALLAASLMIIAMNMFSLAISLDSLKRFRSETRRLSYLAHASAGAACERPPQAQIRIAR